ncbi:LysR family transcriptional regulator [Azospirillum sp. SYSU D00513]|uniref:LysR family transcriptional regulator n=1 Tax=Azospirillum sp. SYSU D00513 TaxID=2812561 RepID=UPI001A95C62B|nr:LysR family transcriptional regulator [Azospirillum sp. SYSU D00513]
MLGDSDLRFFATIAASPSLAAAARALDVTPPAVSQRLAQIEERLGLRLVERGVGGHRLTSEGEMLASRAATILGDLDALFEDLVQRRGTVSGTLRVVAPFGFGRLHIAPLMASFARRHPSVALDLVLTEDPRGAMRTDRWDMLIHVGRLPDLDVVQRKLAPNRRLLCAAPAYIERHGLPDGPKALREHRCGVVREDQADVSLWSLTGPGGERKSVRIQPYFASNDGEVIRAWALEGLGIVERSEWSVADDLRAGRLVEILADWRLPDADVIALMNQRTVRAARIETFVEHLAEALSAPPWASR